MNEKRLKETYHRQRQELEEQEDTIRSYKRKGEQLFVEARQALDYYLQDFALDGEPMAHAQQEFMRNEEEYFELLNVERKKLIKTQDDLDETYYHDLKQLMDKEPN